MLIVHFFSNFPPATPSLFHRQAKVAFHPQAKVAVRAWRLGAIPDRHDESDLGSSQTLPVS